MDLSVFDYNLPPELIAQTPAPQRDLARLLITERNSGSIREGSFADVAELFDPGDIIVLNDTYVFPARLLGRKEPGGAAIEMLLLESLCEGKWEVIAYRASRLKEGTRVVFSETFYCEVIKPLGDGKFQVQFFWEGAWDDALNQHGHIPLPPYIQREDNKTTPEDKKRYQTIFAKHNQTYDSAAAPTASLHFTDQVFSQLKKRGVETANLTLRIGLDTFLPIRCDTIEEHTIHSESYMVPHETAERVNQALQRGNRVIAVGTTAVRTLESAATEDGLLQAGEGRSQLYIYPGYKFKIVKNMFTNFHLPRTTLILLVSAFMGTELWRDAYEHAIKNRFRFYSYGDSMLIL